MPTRSPDRQSNPGSDSFSTAHEFPANEEASEVSSEVLLKGRDHIRILHRGELYTLRETRNGKLILTK